MDKSKECLTTLHNIILWSHLSVNDNNNNRSLIYTREILALKDCEDLVSIYTKKRALNQMSLLCSDGVIDRIEKYTQTKSDKMEIDKAFTVTKKSHRNLFVPALPAIDKIKYFFLLKPSYIIYNIVDKLLYGR